MPELLIKHFSIARLKDQADVARLEPEDFGFDQGTLGLRHSHDAKY